MISINPVLDYNIKLQVVLQSCTLTINNLGGHTPCGYGHLAEYCTSKVRNCIGFGCHPYILQFHEILIIACIELTFYIIIQFFLSAHARHYSKVVVATSWM